MSSLSDNKLTPAQYTEGEHLRGLRSKSSYNYQEIITGLANAGIFDRRILTGDKALLVESLVASITEEHAIIDIYEAVTFTIPGTVNPTAFRRSNRLSTIDAGAQAFDGATVDTLGPITFRERILGVAGQGNDSGSGAGGSLSAVVLQPNTDHVLRFTNLSSSTISATITMNFREVDPREFL